MLPQQGSFFEKATNATVLAVILKRVDSFTSFTLLTLLTGVVLSTPPPSTDSTDAVE